MKLEEKEEVSVICEYERLHTDERICKKIHLVRNVYVNGEKFRNHSWVKQTRRLSNLKIKKGDIISFTAKIKKYLCSKTLEKTKVSFANIRNIEINTKRINHENRRSRL